MVLGYFFAFLSAVLYYSQENKYSQYIKSSNTLNSKIQYLKTHYEEKVNAFYLFEVFFYSSATTYLNHFFNDNHLNWAIVFTFVLSLFIIGFIVRFFIYSLGIRFSNKLIIPFISLIYLFAKLNAPIQVILQLINEKIGGRKDEEDPREELNAILENAHEEGSMENTEYRILTNMMKYHDVHVSDIMTPRTVVFSLSADKTIGEVMTSSGVRMYSRIPIWENDSLDKGLIGYVVAKDILQAALQGKTELKLKEFNRKIYFIPENIELDVALEHFLKTKQHFLMVIDEYGGVSGLLSMEDVLETILGEEIVDEFDKIDDLRTFAMKIRDKRISQSVPTNQVSNVNEE